MGTLGGERKAFAGRLPRRKGFIEDEPTVAPDPYLFRNRSAGLMNSSNLVGCSTGRSAGLAPQKDFVHIGGPTPDEVCNVRSIGHQSTEFHKFPAHRY